MKYHNHWSCEEENNLEKFIMQESKTLVDFFYINILLGNTKWRKTSKFFKKMSDIIKRSPAQCKSKFQKSEEYIYINLLGISKLDYFLYSNLRSNLFNKDRDEEQKDDCSKNKTTDENKRIQTRSKIYFKSEKDTKLEMLKRRLIIAQIINTKEFKINLPKPLESKNKYQEIF